MATIAELIAKHGLPVKIRGNNWAPDQWFEVIANARSYTYPGFNNDGSADFFGAHSGHWDLYTEPKKTRKVKLEAWWITAPTRPRWWLEYSESGKEKIVSPLGQCVRDPKEDREIEIPEEVADELIRLITS